ncbi:MAG: alpha/beta fold hydrolase [Thiohalobacteraceae bacterium]|nr:carboxylesterase [Gammaproteobacteria bacterium]
MPHELLESLIIEPPTAATASVIWLHGLGADGHDFEPLVPELGQLERGVRFVLPHAPHRPVTINAGHVMRAWYDIRGTDIAADTDAAGIRASSAAVGELIATEVARGVPPERIVLAGFSQGGAVALQAGLTGALPLAGILALSTYVPLPGALATDLTGAGRGIPIFMAHGHDDPVVPFALGAASRDHLVALGCRVAFHAYRMPHTLCAEELTDIRAWLDGRLPGR